MIDIYWQMEPFTDCPWEVLKTAPATDETEARIVEEFLGYLPAGSEVSIRREADRWFLDIFEAEEVYDDADDVFQAAAE